MWRFHLIARREWKTIIFVMIMLGLCSLYLTGRWPQQTNAGFGPGWHCTYPGKGDPVCVKDPPKP
jgi:hypothetical protein